MKYTQVWCLPRIRRGVSGVYLFYLLYLMSTIMVEGFGIYLLYLMYLISKFLHAIMTLFVYEINATLVCYLGLEEMALGSTYSTYST